MDSYRTPMDRMFERMQSMWDFDFDVDADRFGGRRGHALSLDRDGDDYVVVADIPGFEREELDVRFDDGILYIEGEHEVAGSGARHSRRVHEHLRVPGEVVVEEISASYRNGVLEIRLPVETEEDDDAHVIDVE